MAQLADEKPTDMIPNFGSNFSLLPLGVFIGFAIMVYEPLSMLHKFGERTSKL